MNGVVLVKAETVGWTPSKKRMTVPCCAENRKVRARPPKGMKRAKWIALPAKGRLNHSLMISTSW